MDSRAQVSLEYLLIFLISLSILSMFSIPLIEDTVSDVNDIKKGDIIRYKMDDYYVIHRVVMIAEDKDGLYFVMKGDNNDNVDLYPIRSSMIDGIIKFDIPYAGYPTLIVNKMVNPEREDTVKVDKGRMN